MHGTLIVIGSLAVALALLGAESVVVRRTRRRIPVRIAVLGTRGKSSVVRLITAGLRGGGRRVVCKTTGSCAMVGAADGTERELPRRGRPTPLEQRRILRFAVRERADVAVVEAMSIRPESLRAELRRILAPTLVVVTGVGPDHVADIEDPCAAFADAVPDAATVVANSAVPDALRERLLRRGLRVLEPGPTAGDPLPTVGSHEEWPENVETALATCALLGVDRDAARRGMRQTVADVGALAAWRVPSGLRSWVAVNGFAANDPVATRRTLDRALVRWGRRGQPLVGVLNLRRDRGDRTLQWVDALTAGGWPFDRLVVVGPAAWWVRRPLRRALRERVRFLPDGVAGRVMAAISDVEPDGIVFGFGNLAGAGLALVRAWRERGEPA